VALRSINKNISYLMLTSRNIKFGMYADDEYAHELCRKYCF